MASTSKEKEVSSLPKEDGSQHDDAMQEDPESYKAVKDWDIDFILEKLRHTECSLLLERTFDSNTLLHVAASLGHDQIVEAILSIQQCQELLTAKNSSGDLPLHVAANAGHLPIVVKLLNRSFQHFKAQNSDAATAERSTMVDFVVMSHQYYELLMAKNSNGDLPLHVAANAGHFSIVRHLVMLSDEYHREFLRVQNSNGDHPLHLAANAGHLSIVQHFIMLSHQYQELLMLQNSNGDLPLHLAANAGHLSIVQHLVKSCHQRQEHLMVQNSNGDLPLHVAANAGHLSVVQHLVKFSYRCLELLTPKNSGDNIPLPYPPVDANVGNQPSVDLSDQKLQDRYNSKLLRVKNKEGNTPLHLALIKKYEEEDLNLKTNYHEVAKFLIEKDPDACTDLNKANKDPLDLAIKAQDKELQQLMSNLAPPVAEPFSAYRDAQMMNQSRDKDPEHSAVSPSDITPELNEARNYPHGMAIEAPDAELRKLMLDFVPECMAVKEALSIAPIMIVQRGPQNKPLEMVPPKRKSIKGTSMDGELYKAVKCRDINFILKKAQDPEHSALSDKTPELNTILHLAAASSCDHQFVESILKIQPCQKFVTEKNSNGNLPLHVAASAGNIQIVEHLVKWSDEHLKDHCNCVPLVEKNMEGNTPLHLALIKKVAQYNEVAKFLVKKCPEVSFYPNKERKSPLYLAVEGGDEELVKLMITTNRLPHGKSIVHAALYYLTTIDLPNGRTIVHTAIYGSYTARKNWCLNTHAASFLCPSMCLNTNTDILDTVLKSLPDDILKEKDDKGMTPLFYAASIGYLDGVGILLKKPTKCCAYERDTDGYYPIHIASKKGHIQVIKKFLKIYPDMIELLNEEGQNILHVAAMYGKVKVVTYMLKGHDLNVEMLINKKDQNGNTPLHLATMGGHPRVVWHLTWDKRVDLKALNKEGKRALDIALNDSGEDPSFAEQLTWDALRYVTGPTETPQSPNVGKTLRADKYKERTDTLLLVATLVATVTFAAAFTMPGGYNGPGGMATFLEKPMFQVFVISNTIAMYSAITAVIGLIWAHLGDLKLFIAAYKFSLPILGLAIIMVSLAFMAGNYLVLRDLNWLAYLVLSIGSLFLFTLSIIFFPLFLPNSSPHPIIRYLLRYPFYLLIMFTRCDTDDREGE